MQGIDRNRKIVSCHYSISLPVKAYQKAQEQQAGQNNQGPKENEDGTVDASYEEKK